MARDDSVAFPAGEHRYELDGASVAIHAPSDVCANDVRHAATRLARAAREVGDDAAADRRGEGAA